MAILPPDQPDQPASRTEEHGPLPTARVPPGQYDPTFLEALKANGQVRAVGPDWNGDVTQLPPNVNWILHPNGDLERVGFD
jgi:hypothetical protein